MVKKFRPLHVMLTIMSTYKRDFDEKNMSFFLIRKKNCENKITQFVIKLAILFKNKFQGTNLQ